MTLVLSAGVSPDTDLSFQFRVFLGNIRLQSLFFFFYSCEVRHSLIIGYQEAALQRILIYSLRFRNLSSNEILCCQFCSLELM